MPPSPHFAFGICIFQQCLWTERQGALLRARQYCSSRQPLCGYEEEQWADGTCLQPFVWYSLDRASLFHSLWSVGSSRYVTFPFYGRNLGWSPIKVFNHGDMLRDFTYVDDIVEGVIRVLDHTATPNPKWNAVTPDPATSIAPIGFII